MERLTFLGLTEMKEEVQVGQERQFMCWEEEENEQRGGAGGGSPGEEEEEKVVGGRGGSSQNPAEMNH